MSDDKGTEQNLVRVKADATGVDVAIGGGFGAFLERLLPSKVRFRRAVDDAISGQILGKLARREELDEAESAFAEEVVSDNARKYFRVRMIQERAQQLLEAQPVVLLPAVAPSEGAVPAQTSSDWINRFREDASLVDNEVVREVYARVLAEEVRRPGAFSLRTLGVLRYLDHEAATAFGKMRRMLLANDNVPRWTEDVLASTGLSYTDLLRLDDAGLVSFNLNSVVSLSKAPVSFLVINGQRRLLRLERKTKNEVDIPVHILTPAGQQLARIAEGEADESTLSTLLSWLRPHLKHHRVQMAELPAPFWNLSIEGLTWVQLDT